MVVIDADEAPDQAVVVADSAATEKDTRLVDGVFIIDGEDFLVLLHVLVNSDDVI